MSGSCLGSQPEVTTDLSGGLTLDTLARVGVLPDSFFFFLSFLCYFDGKGRINVVQFDFYLHLQMVNGSKFRSTWNFIFSVFACGMDT
jgi:hypothetical protein